MYPDIRKQFGRELASVGFQKLEVGQNTTTESWRGELTVDWTDPTTQKYCTSSHCVEIQLPAAFPFEMPLVYPCDTDPPIQNSRHQTPGNPNGALCLWAKETGDWTPHIGGYAVINRIRQWLIRYHRDDWSKADRPPDLHLYFPTRTERPMMLISTDWQPSNASVVGKFGIWQRPGNLRWCLAGAPTAEIKEPSLDNSDRVLKLLAGVEKRSYSQVGVWFRLQREPIPQHNLLSLLAEIDNASGQVLGWSLKQLTNVYGSKLTKLTSAELALGYPGAEGQETWLFVRAYLPIGVPYNRGKNSTYLKKSRVESYETVRVDPAGLMRRTQHTASNLGNTQVIIFGQGAIGSSLALLLAKAGVSTLRLVDSDRIKPGNVIRHASGLYSIGSLKTFAVASQIASHSPDCRVFTERETWDIETLRDWITQANLVIDATANPTFSLLLNEICSQESRTALYVTAHRRSTVGRLRVVRPGQDACLRCYEYHSSTPVYPLIPPLRDEGNFIETGCGTPTSEASAVDIEGVTNQAARAALWHLQDKLASKNHCLIINEETNEMPEKLQQPGVYWDAWLPVTGCPACKTRK